MPRTLMIDFRYERDAFWDTYGRLPATPNAAQRARFYQILHSATLRFEANRSSGGTASALDVNAAIRELVSLL